MSDTPLEARIQRLEDIEAIKQLKADYCNFLDGGWPEKGPSHRGPIGNLFVEDAVWDGRPHAPLAEGREAICEMVRDYRAVPFIMHCVTNPTIQVNGDRATGHWHIIVPLNQPDHNGYLTLGTYDDVYVRAADRWKFQSLRFTGASVTPRGQAWIVTPAPIDPDSA